MSFQGKVVKTKCISNWTEHKQNHKVIRYPGMYGELWRFWHRKLVVTVHSIGKSPRVNYFKTGLD